MSVTVPREELNSLLDDFRKGLNALRAYSAVKISHFIPCGLREITWDMETLDYKIASIFTQLDCFRKKVKFWSNGIVYKLKRDL